MNYYYQIQQSSKRKDWYKSIQIKLTTLHNNRCMGFIYVTRLPLGGQLKIEVNAFSDPSEHLAPIVCINLFSANIKCFVFERTSNCSYSTGTKTCQCWFKLYVAASNPALTYSLLFFY